MKKRWLFVLIAVVILLAIPAGSLAAGNVHDGVLLEGEETAGATPTPEPPAPTPTATVESTATIAPIGIPATLTAYLGKTPSLHIKNYAPTEVQFTSSDPSVAIVEPNNAYIDSYKEGITTVKGTVKGTNYSETCVVTVKRAHVQSLSLENFPTKLYKGQADAIKASFEPYEANYNFLGDFEWSSSNPSIIFLYEDGLDDATVYYEARGPGTATVTVKADGVSASVTVTVSGTPTPTIVPTPTVTATSSVTPRPPSSVAAAVVPTSMPTRGAEGEGYSGPMPTRVPIELEASDWEAAQQAIAGMEPGSLGSIQLPDDTLVPASLLETLRQTQCALEIDMGGYLCVIDGAYLAEIRDDLASIDIGMTMEKDAAVSAACGGSAYEMHFSYHGELPGTFTFRVPAEGSSPGDTIYLYYLNEDTGVFEGVHTAIVDDEGYVSLNITHCSSYFITDIMIEGAVNNFALPAVPTAEPEAQRSSGFAAFVEKNSIVFWICVYVLGCGAIVTLFIVIFRRRDKRKEEPVQHTYMK